MKPYAKAALIGGVIIPLMLHFLAPDRMPWWPDTASMAIGFGVVAVVLVWKKRADREMNQRLGGVLKTFGEAIGRHLDSRG